jgi:hypothetical protein
VIPSYANPQDLNRYSYVNNNPLRYNDPTGHMRVTDYDLSKNKASLSCSKNSEYCNNGKPMTKAELKAVWDQKQYRNKHPIRALLEDAAKNKLTPLILSTVQEVGSVVQDAGLILTLTGEGAPIGAAVFIGGYIVGRTAGVLGTADTIYQYYNHLNGTNGTDVYMSIGTTVAGIYPPFSSKSGAISTVYTALRLGVDVPEIPFPIK